MNNNCCRNIDIYNIFGNESKILSDNIFPHCCGIHHLQCSWQILHQKGKKYKNIWCLIFRFLLIVNICCKTTVSYETRRLTEMEFPMYFSLGPDPGYNISHLETCGVGGEWQLFTGSWSDSAWVWGGNCSIEGKI